MSLPQNSSSVPSVTNQVDKDDLEYVEAEEILAEDRHDAQSSNQ